MDTADSAHVAPNLSFFHVPITSEPAHVTTPSPSPSKFVEPDMITSVPESPLSNPIVLSTSDVNLLRSTCSEDQTFSHTSDYVFPQEYFVQTFPRGADEPLTETDYYFTVTLPIRQAQAFKNFLTFHLLRDPVFLAATPSWSTVLYSRNDTLYCTVVRLIWLVYVR